MIGYLCAYLRYYYPLEFITAYLNNAHNQDDIQAGTQLAKQKNIEIKPICFGYSNSGYSPDKNSNSIFKGVGSIKFLNDNVAKELLDIYPSTKQLTFIELLEYIKNNTSATNRQIEILIKLDYFSEFGGNKKLLNGLDLFKNFYGKSQIKKDKLPTLPFSESDVASFSQKETAKQFTGVNMISLIDKTFDSFTDETLSVHEQLNSELDYLGYCASTFVTNENYYMVVDINNKYTPRVVLYNLSNGESIEVKCPKKNMIYKNVQLFDKGDILNIKNFTERKRHIMLNGEWVESNETELILANFGMIRRASKGENDA